MCKKPGSLRPAGHRGTLHPCPNTRGSAVVLFFPPFLTMRASSFLMLIANRLIKAKLKATPWVLLCCTKNTSWLPWRFFFNFFFFYYSVSLPLFFFYTPVVPATHVPPAHMYTRVHTAPSCPHCTPRTLSSNFITRRSVPNIYILGRMSSTVVFARVVAKGGEGAVELQMAGGGLIRGEKKEAERTVVGALKQKP